jgi:hypothetical protein
MTPFVGLNERFREVLPILQLRVEPEVALDSLELALASDPAVEWVTRNHHYRPNFVPNDSLYAEEWWLQKVSAPMAWEVTHGDSGILIGIIDTGVDYLHPDLISKIWVNSGDANSNGIDDDDNGFVDDSIGWDFVDAPSLPGGGDNLVRDRDPMDEMGHGTYVSGVAAAATDNSTCVASLGFNCRIMCLRAGNANGYLEEDDIAAAILYATANGARIINMSFGDVVASPLLRETIQIAFQAGVVLVGSAGNNSSATIHYPSGFPEVISVGATDRYDRKAGFSNYGPSVDVMAPADEILSTILGGECGEWRFPSGTSYAAPQVAALAGLVLSVNAGLLPTDVKQLIRSTADDIGRPGWDSLTSHGRINARRAVEQAQFGSDVVARITSPENDAGVSEGFAVRGEALGAAFDHWELYYGLGENPSPWNFVAQGISRVHGDSIGFIDTPAQDTILIVRLEVHGISGETSVANTHLYVQHSAPQIDSLRVRRMLDRDTYGDLVQVWSNQVTNATLILTNAAGDSAREDFGYVSKSHTALLSQLDYSGTWQCRVRLENQAGMATWSESFMFSVETPPFSSNLWTRSVTSLPNGYLGSFVTDYDLDNKPEVWLAPIDANGVLSPLSNYEWNGSDFDSAHDNYSIHLPQDLGDADGDSLLEMMARRFEETRIWEQRARGGTFDSLVFEDTLNFIGTNFLDLDPNDGHGEIIARQNTSADGQSRPRYVIFEVGSNYSLTARDTLPNDTFGANNLGAPRVLIGDLDRDGLLDFLYGDYDGDLIFCEYDGGHPLEKWRYRLPQNDATSWLDKGDLDGDGDLEFIAGCGSSSAGGTESQIRSRHWEYFIFERATDNNFIIVDSVFILGNENSFDHPASVTVGDVDADGTADILISAFPDFYVISYDHITGRYVPRWYYSPSASNISLVTDWDHDGVNEFFFSDGTQFLRVEAASASGQRPRPPLNLTGEPIGTHAISLAWNREAQADSFRVYRSGSLPDFEWIASTIDTHIVLDGVQENAAYTYAVASVNWSYHDSISALSNYQVVVANSPPAAVDTAQFIRPHFVRLRFSEAMGPSSLEQRAYRLDDLRMPAIVTPDEGGRVIFLAFDGGFQRRWYSLSLLELRDAQGSRLPGPESTIVFEVVDTVVVLPRVVFHRLLGGVSASQVEIAFSEPMSHSVMEVSHYVFVEDEHRRVTAVDSLEADRSRVRVALDPRYPVGSLGIPARLKLVGIYGEDGLPLDSTGSAEYLVLGGAASSISDAFVFPNPYKGVGPNGEQCVYFAGLPGQATIRVFTLRGTLVKKIEHSNFTGAARWELENEDHEQVASGVYLYTIEANDQTKRGKIALMR